MDCIKEEVEEKINTDDSLIPSHISGIEEDKTRR